jgi:hypothetical protein
LGGAPSAPDDLQLQVLRQRQGAPAGQLQELLQEQPPPPGPDTRYEPPRDAQPPLMLRQNEDM